MGENRAGLEGGGLSVSNTGEQSGCSAHGGFLTIFSPSSLASLNDLKDQINLSDQMITAAVSLVSFTHM